MNFIKRYLFPEHLPYTASSLLILAARIAFGLTFLSHGIAKWMTFEDSSLSFPDPLGIGSMLSFSLVIFAEVFCSVGFIMGALFRLCLIPMIVTMCVAFFVIHANDAFAAKELAFIYLVIFIIMFFTGAGKYSVDAMIRKAME